MNVMTAPADIPAAELVIEKKVFDGFCHHLGDDPQDWTLPMMRQYRKRIRKCRKCFKGDAS